MNRRVLSLSLSILILFSHTSQYCAETAVPVLAAVIEAAPVIVEAVAGGAATVAGYVGLKTLEQKLKPSPAHDVSAPTTTHDPLCALKELPPVYGFLDKGKTLSHKEQYLINVRIAYEQHNSGIPKCTFEEFVKKHPYDPNTNILTTAKQTIPAAVQAKPVTQEAPVQTASVVEAAKPTLAAQQTTSAPVSTQPATIVTSTTSSGKQQTVINLGVIKQSDIAVTSSPVDSVKPLVTSTPDATTTALGTPAQTLSRGHIDTAPTTTLQSKIESTATGLGAAYAVKQAADKGVFTTITFGKPVEVAQEVGKKGFELLKDEKVRKTLSKLSIWEKLLKKTGEYAAQSSEAVKAVAAKVAEKASPIIGPIIEKLGPFAPYVGPALQVYGAYKMTKDVYNGAKAVHNYMSSSPQDKLKGSQPNNQQQGSGGSHEPEKKPENPEQKLATATKVAAAEKLSSDAIEEGVQWALKHRLDHVFDNPGHKLNQLVQKIGCQEKTIRAVLNSVKDKLPENGVFRDIPTQVEGFTVYVRGNMINGVPKLGTMFIK